MVHFNILNDYLSTAILTSNHVLILTCMRGYIYQTVKFILLFSLYCLIILEHHCDYSTSAAVQMQGLLNRESPACEVMYTWVNAFENCFYICISDGWSTCIISIHLCSQKNVFGISSTFIYKPFMVSEGRNPLLGTVMGLNISCV